MAGAGGGTTHPRAKDSLAGMRAAHRATMPACPSTRGARAGISSRSIRPWPRSSAGSARAASRPASTPIRSPRCCAPSWRSRCRPRPRAPIFGRLCAPLPHRRAACRAPGAAHRRGAPRRRPQPRQGALRARLGGTRRMTAGSTLRALPAHSDDEAIAALTAVKGIGTWTAEVFLMFHLRTPDVFPSGDLALMVAIQRTYGCARARPRRRPARWPRRGGPIARWRAGICGSSLSPPRPPVTARGRAT